MNRRSFLRGLLLAVPGVALLSRPSDEVTVSHDSAYCAVSCGQLDLERWREEMVEVSYQDMRIVPQIR